MIQRYAVNLAALREEELVSCRAVLSEERRAKADRFRFEKDRIRCILAEATVRYVMKISYGIDPQTVCIIQDKKGRPMLAEPNDIPLDFNISHAGDWVVCSIGSERSGIDIEHIADAKERLAEKVLSEREWNTWKALPPEEKPKAFYQIWTLKESYTKQTGDGLSQPFCEIATEPTGTAAWRVIGDPERIMLSQRWGVDYYLSLCAPASAQVSPEVILLDARRMETFFQSGVL